MTQFDSDHQRRVTGNLAGKIFSPSYPLSQKPIPSSQFSYDHNNCKDWFDRWLERGGTVARDCIYIKIANDLSDLRSYDDLQIWVNLDAKLKYRRARMRKAALMAEIRQARRKIVYLK